MPEAAARKRVLEHVRTRCAERNEPVVAASELKAEASLGDSTTIDAAIRELLLAGDLNVVRAGGIFLAPGSDGDRRRRAALLELTKKVLGDIGGRGEPLDEVVEAMRIVDSLRR
jgi:hypothetical protein